MRVLHIELDGQLIPRTDAERVAVLRDALDSAIEAMKNMIAVHNGTDHPAAGPAAQHRPWIAQQPALMKAERALKLTEPEEPKELVDVAQDILESIARVRELESNRVHQYVPRLELDRWEENLRRALAQHQ